MEDQVWELEQMGIAAKYLAGSLDFETQQKQIMEEFRTNQLKLLYLTPERLVNNSYLHFVLNQLYNDDKLARFVIDEAHCASQWGHDFREDYLKLDILRKHWPNVPILAVTATSSEAVTMDIVNILQFKDPQLFVLL
eukprot:UN28444